MDAGTYELAYNYDYHALVSGMTETGGTRTTVRVMLPEGATCAQIFALLEKNGVCTAEKLGESAANTQFDYWFLEDIPYGETNRLEGFLFPDTYDFYVNDDPDRVLEKLLSNFNRKFSDDASAQLETLNTALAERWTAKGYDESYIEAHRMTIYDLVTVASMIEKETASAKESSTIASVIYNRLCDPANYPYLNIDATIVYALGGIDGALTYEDTQIDSPYNTYNRTGLPAGPIRPSWQGRTMRKPELLAPAGDMERLRMAVLYGADAVYLAGTSFGMRSFAGNFSPEELPEAVAFAHAHGVRVHVTVNTMPRGDELPALPAHLRLLNDSGVDALILADLGVFRMAQREAPNCELHISTQVSIANAACAAAWHELGAKRVVLARELSLEEIRVIRRDTPPELELETFAHGAMCVSYSGRCLLSNYMTGRDSNRGACAQPCRYQYALMEEKRPGEYFPVFEDEKGTYIMNSRDMCMIDHLAELAEAGVDCIKVEGRAKSAYYAAIITGAYRHALDAVAAGEPVDPVWRDEVEHVSHRRYSTGFFFGQPGQYTESSRYIRDWQVCAIVTDCTPDGMATLSLRNKFAAGDEVEIVGPDTRPFSVTVPVMQDADGLPLREPRTPQMVFRMQLPRRVPAMSIVRRAVDLSAK